MTEAPPHPTEGSALHPSPIGDTLGSPYDSVWRRVRAEVLERDGWRCQIRGPGCTTVATEGDHIVPLVDGGARLDKANVRAACKHCNASRGNRMLRERYEWAKDAPEPVAAGPSRKWF